MSEEDPIHQFFTPTELTSPYALYTALSLTPSSKTDAQGIPASDIRTSYRRAALKYHPDKHASKSEEERKEVERQFQRVGFAFAVLSDEGRRKQQVLRGSFDAGGARLTVCM
jgi:DnaJ family protein C protein 9